MAVKASTVPNAAYWAIKKNLQAGMSVDDACKAAKSWTSVYYYERKKDPDPIPYKKKDKVIATKSLVPSSPKREKTAGQKPEPRLIHLTVPESPALQDGEVTVAFCKIPISLLKEFFGN